MVITGRLLVIWVGGTPDGEEKFLILGSTLAWPLTFVALAIFGVFWGLWKLMTVDIPNPVTAVKKRRRRKLTYEELLVDIERRERELEMGDQR
jgi:hypothetical protein